MTHSELSHPSPSLPLSLWLDYRDMFYLSLPPSLTPFLSIFSPYICRLPLCVYSSFPWKRRLSLPPRHLPVLSPTMDPLISPYIHPSIFPIHHCHSFSAPSLSSFLPSFHLIHSCQFGTFLEKCVCSLPFFKAFLFILVLLSPLLHSFFDLSFPC